jgi:hypothetical protein
VKGSDLFRALERRVSRVRVSLVRSRLRRTKRLRFHIDALHCSYNVAVCRGWVFCENEKVSSLELVLVQNGRTCSHGMKHGLKRQDVERHFGSKKARRSGFSGRAFLEDVEDKVEVFLAVDFEEAERVLIFAGVAWLEPHEGRILRNRELYSAKKRPRNRSVALYANSMGNYFFEEIRDLLEAGFEASGYSVHLRDETEGFAIDVDWHVIIAPHEFFYLGMGIDRRSQNTPLNTVFLNTEQPSTEWFGRAYDMFPRAYAIWDVSASSAAELARSCGFASYLPLGYVEDLPVFDAVRTLPDHEGTCFLDSETHAMSHLETPLEKRPIDIFFVGHASDRRQEFLAKHAAFFAEYDCYFHLSPLGDPVVPH